MRYVRSHPERYSKDKEQWTRHMWGNHLADRTCALDYSDHGALRDPINLVFPVRQALELFTQEDTLYWADANGHPTLRSFDEVFDENLLNVYEQTRDKYRQERIPHALPKWSGNLRRSSRFATECAEVVHKSKGDKARMLRIIWDHHMHGGNNLKMGLTGGACNMCQEQDSAKHWISECKHPVAVQSRAETAELVEQHLSN